MDVLTTIWDFITQDSPRGNSTPSENVIRITEDGKTRTTEDGKIRILEN